MKEGEERRKNLSEEAITKAVIIAIGELDKQQGSILSQQALENSIKKVLVEAEIKSCPLLFHDKEEERIFVETMPKLIELHDNIEKTKTGSKFILGLFFVWVLKDLYDTLLPYAIKLVNLLTDVDKLPPTL